MNKGKIRDILIDQMDERESLEKDERIMPREVQSFWAPFAQKKWIKTTIGIRQCGKTVLAHLLLKDEPYASVNFDDERLAFIETDDLNDVLEGLYEVYGDFKYLLLDEVQNVVGWELFVNRIKRQGINIFVTGSNAKLLSRELSTHISGRFVQIEMYPFSFNEYLSWSGITKHSFSTKEKARVKKHLEDYIEIGGFPEVVKAPGLRNTYLIDLYQSIITRDVITRYNIRYQKTFKEMATNVISNYSTLISYNKLRKSHGLKSAHTAKNYVDYLQEVYLVQLIDKYSPKPKEILNSPKKVYAVDTGMINSLALSVSENTGKSMENLVCYDLLRQKSIDPTLKIFYWRDHQDREIDFVVLKGLKVLSLIQVTFASGMDEIGPREKRSLLKASEFFKCKDMTVITWDLEDEEIIDGKKIFYVPLWKWLLRNR